MHLSHFIGSLTLSLLFVTQAVAATEQEIQIPMSDHGFFGRVQHTLTATEYRPEGAGPFPLILINHGSPRTAADRVNTTGKYALQSKALAAQGFVVVNPVRRGYGKSDGVWAEDYFSCSNPSYYEAGMETAKDIAATLEHVRSKPYVDATRIVLLGQSAGGFGALALASQSPAGVLGTINFAGGRGSRGPNQVCNEDRLVDTFSRYAGTTKTPMLWFYSENDLYFGPALAARLADSYRSKGVDMHYIAAPAYGKDGHAFFSDGKNVSAWMGEVLAFMKKIRAIQ